MKRRFAHKRAHPDLNQGPADLQSAALTTELCTQMAHFLVRAQGNSQGDRPQCLREKPRVLAFSGQCDRVVKVMD